MKSLVWIKEKAPLGDVAPTPREGHTLTYIPETKSLLMFGGLHNNIRMNEIYLYDIEKNIWKLQTTTGRQPSPRCFHSAFYEEPYFFVYGGQGENGKSLGDLNFLNVNTWEWKLLFVLEAPPSRHFTTVCDMDNQEREKIIFGGVSSPDNKLHNDLWIVSYNSVTFNSVLPKIPGTVCTLKKAKGEVPAPRRGHCATVYNKSLIVYGGETADPEDANWIFQLSFDTWTWKKTPGLGRPLNARTFASYCLFDKSNLLMFGGIENQTDKYLNDINILNLNDFKWSSPFVGGHPPTPRYNHACCGYEIPYEGKGMIIIGGLEAGYCNMGLFKLTEKEAKEYTEIKKTTTTTITKEFKDFSVPERREVREVRETREVNAFESITTDQKNQIGEIERAIAKEKKYTTDLEKEIAALEQELKQAQNDQNFSIQKLEDQITALDEEYLVKYQYAKQLFSLIPIEQFIMAEGNTKNAMLEEVVQKTESYLIALDKLYIAISKYKIDASDDQEIRLRDLYESVQGDVLKLREMHKNSLHFLKSVYDEHAHLVGKVEAEINMQRERILEIDRKYKEILVQSEVEDL